MAPPEDTWLRQFHETPEASITLVCLPHAGGAASSYFGLSEALGPGIRVLSVQYPGRQDRRFEKCPAHVADYVSEISLSIMMRVPGPVAIFGHSFGATLAFETALQLERSGRDLTKLFVSGRRAPAEQREHGLSRRSDAVLIAELRHLSGTHPEFLLDQEMLNLILPGLRGDYRALDNYRYRVGDTVRCDIRGLCGTTDLKVSPEEIGKWADYTSAHTRTTVFEGGHFYLFDQLQALTRVLRQDLASPWASSSPGAGRAVEGVRT